jgi:hypothetical protein
MQHEYLIYSNYILRLKILLNLIYLYENLRKTIPQNYIWIETNIYPDKKKIESILEMEDTDLYVDVDDYQFVNQIIWKEVKVVFFPFDWFIKVSIGVEPDVEVENLNFNVEFDADVPFWTDVNASSKYGFDYSEMSFSTWYYHILNSEDAVNSIMYIYECVKPMMTKLLRYYIGI